MKQKTKIEIAFEADSLLGKLGRLKAEMVELSTKVIECEMTLEEIIKEISIGEIKDTVSGGADDGAQGV